MAIHPRHELALFSGGGGLSLGLKLAIPGLRTVAHVEREAYAAATLVARMEEARLDPAPVWDDVVTFDGHPWRGVVDLVAGGFPCQDVSNAGKRKGLAGERSGLWREFRRIIAEVQPRFVFIENVAALVSRGLEEVLGDLASLGFDAEWGVFSAAEAGAPHRRERLFILAYAGCARQLQPQGGEPRERRRVGDGGDELADSYSERHDRWQTAQTGWSTDSDEPWSATQRRGDELADALGVGRGQGRPESTRPAGGPGVAERGGSMANPERSRLALGGRVAGDPREELPAPQRGGDPRPFEWPPLQNDVEGWAQVLAERPDLAPALPAQSGFRGVVDGMADRVERLRLLGNGVVPTQAALAYRVLHSRLFGG